MLNYLVSPAILDLCRARVVAVEPSLWGDRSLLLACALQFASGAGWLSDPPLMSASDRRDVKSYRRRSRIVNLIQRRKDLTDHDISIMSEVSISLVRRLRQQVDLAAISPRKPVSPKPQAIGCQRLRRQKSVLSSLYHTR